MENKIQQTSAAFNAISWVAMIGGVIVYLVGLWNAEIPFNEKGYYIAVLVLGLFSAISLQKTVRDRMENIPTTDLYHGVCILAFMISVILLVAGLWNASLLLSEKGFYGVTFFLGLFGAVAVQKNVRDAVNKREGYISISTIEPDDKEY
ncbi:MAG: inner membrane protein YiaA [Rouxiella aceris]|uniref:inner membrane protein YiaA n=1 Tax=Rouxiella aceris TaxID=2703884 RepID=UPI00283AFD1A|nr:inner membrane protein YiaA [Rouxiella aceris]MDR3432727.1 inner membrane protein YiaA [Rouxiella aceris]